MICSKCGDKITQDKTHLIKLLGPEPSPVCEECRRMAQGGAVRAEVVHKTIRVAAGETRYDVLQQTCTPIAWELYRATMCRAGLPVTPEEATKYLMGFVDAVYSIVCGDLKVVMVEQDQEVKL